MESDIPLVEIPDYLARIIGTPDEGTRMFRAFGVSGDAFDVWMGAVSVVCGPEGNVSPGGVAMFANVSRSGVHKRMEEGRITAFIFHKVEKKLFGRYEITNTICDIPVVEARAWGELLKKKTPEEAEKDAVGDRDYDAMFVFEPPKGAVEKWKAAKRRTARSEGFDNE